MGAIEAFNFDLHCHSTVSDGLLAPAEVVRRATANGVSVLALTDHDELAGLADAADAARASGMRFVPGVEISVTWAELTIHIVGLGIDPANVSLAENLAHLRTSRGRRAERIAAEFDALGIPGTLAGAYAYAENPDADRPRTFRALPRRVRRGPRRRDGVPALPRPRQAGLRAAAMGRTCRRGGVDSRERRPRRRRPPGPLQPESPGAAPVSRRIQGRRAARASRSSPAATRRSSTPSSPRFAREFGFLASRGSDFHGPDESAVDLGRLPPLPADLKPVWHDW